MADGRAARPAPSEGLLLGGVGQLQEGAERENGDDEVEHGVYCWRPIISAATASPWGR